MAKVKFSHDLTDLKEDRFIQASKEVEVTEERAKEITANIERDFGVKVTFEVLEADKEDQSNDEGQPNDEDQLDLKNLGAKELKEVADKRGVEYNRNATAEQMLELLGE